MHDEEILEVLDKIKYNIQNMIYSEVQKKDLFDILHEYAEGKIEPIDPLAIAYLFRGWALSNTVDMTAEENRGLCPLCLK